MPDDDMRDELDDMEMPEPELGDEQLPQFAGDMEPVPPESDAMSRRPQRYAPEATELELEATDTAIWTIAQDLPDPAPPARNAPPPVEVQQPPKGFLEPAPPVEPAEVQEPPEGFLDTAEPKAKPVEVQKPPEDFLEPAPEPESPVEVQPPPKGFLEPSGDDRPKPTLPPTLDVNEQEEFEGDDEEYPPPEEVIRRSRSRQGEAPQADAEPSSDASGATADGRDDKLDELTEKVDALSDKLDELSTKLDEKAELLAEQMEDTPGRFT